MEDRFVAPSRPRAAIVLLIAVLHVGSGVVSAVAACCDGEVHAAGTKMMECCLKGGPNHICPYMSKSRRSKAPGRINVYCPAGHDTGAPVTGFVALPERAVTVQPMLLPSVASSRLDDRADSRIVYPPTPPPRVFS